MSLSARITEPPAARPPGLPCSIGALRRELPTDEAAALDRMLWELSWTAAQVYDALEAEGHRVSLQTVGRHRNHRCRCETSPK